MPDLPGVRCGPAREGVWAATPAGPGVPVGVLSESGVDCDAGNPAPREARRATEREGVRGGDDPLAPVFERCLRPLLRD